MDFYVWLSDSMSELSTGSKVNVSNSSPGKDAYVSASDSARIVNDPDLALVRVDVDVSEYGTLRRISLYRCESRQAGNDAAATGKRSK